MGTVLGAIMVIGAIAMFVSISSVNGQVNRLANSGNELSRKFASVGDMTGKSLDEISLVTGHPNARTAMPEGHTLCQWSAVGYSIAIMFDDELCFVGIVREVSV